MKNFPEILTFENPDLKLRCWERKCRFSTSSACSHWHELVEIVYNRHGSGIQQINETFFTVRPGTMSVVMQNQLHSYAACNADEEIDLLTLQFDAESLMSHIPENDPVRRDWLSQALFFPNAIPVTPELRVLLETILNEVSEQKPGYIEIVTGCLLQLTAILSRTCPQRLSPSEIQQNSSRNREMLSSVFVFIIEHYQEENLSLKDAARTACLSVTQFCRLFKLVTRMGFHEYLNQYRVSCAEQMLEAGKSLTETAFSCGFGSLSSFSRNFKKYRGTTPGHFCSKLSSC